MLKKIILLTFIISQSHLVEAGSKFRKVVWIVFENANYSNVIVQEDFKEYAKKGVLFSNMMAETHPSQPNYIAMIAGSTLGVVNNNNVDLNENHIGDLLEKHGKKWKVFAEGYPGNCFLGKESGDYARKHVPFLSFLNVTKNPSRCANIQNEKGFFKNLESGNLPEYSMYIPNQINDGHDTDIEYSGKWLKKNFGKYLNNPKLFGDVLFVLTYDESGISVENKIYTSLIGANVKANIVNNQPLNHYSLLRMIQEEFGIGNLGREDAKAIQIQGIWK